MITLPYMYGITLIKDENHNFKAFRSGTHGTYKLEGYEDVLRFYVKETPVERLLHKITYTDKLIFIADELYQPDEYNIFLESGYFIALKAWRAILEWGERLKNYSASVGTQVFLSSDIMAQVKEIDEAAGINTSSGVNAQVYSTVQIDKKRSYMRTSLNLNKLDTDGYPSWRTETIKRKNQTYSSVVCYAGLSPLIPSFINGKGPTSYTYLYREELKQNKEYSGIGFYTFYKAYGNEPSDITYTGFTCASILQTTFIAVEVNQANNTSSLDNVRAIWEDPQIRNGFNLVVPKITETLLMTLKAV